MPRVAWWQAKWINTLLNRHEEIYKGEIDRMSETQKRLLTHVLGEQPSSHDVPSVEELREVADDVSGEVEGRPQ